MTKLAIVTGGTRGIGAAISLKLKNAGFTVVANYNSNKTTAEDFGEKNDILVRGWDVGNYQSCQDAVAEIESIFGQSVDVLINNAGITRDGMMHKMQENTWLEVVETNLNSCFNMSRAVINQMRAKSYGRIINISSINALSGQVGQTNYAAAKAGIIGFTKSLALETAAKNVTVNAVAPGYIATDMTAKIPSDFLEQIIQSIPVKRLGSVDDIARVVLFLAEESAGFITGETISVNGGQYSR